AGPVLNVALVSAEVDEVEVEAEDSAPEEAVGAAGTEGLAPGTTVEWSDLAQAPSITEGASEPEVDFGTEDDGQITLNF
ncbi:MAG: hypothetical protein ACO3HG_04705, partial [Schleiferiaceae bacterium]